MLLFVILILNFYIRIKLGEKKKIYNFLFSNHDKHEGNNFPDWMWVQTDLEKVTQKERKSWQEVFYDYNDKTLTNKW